MDTLLGMYWRTMEKKHEEERMIMYVSEVIASSGQRGRGYGPKEHKEERRDLKGMVEEEAKRLHKFGECGLQFG